MWGSKGLTSVKKDRGHYMTVTCFESSLMQYLSVIMQHACSDITDLLQGLHWCAASTNKPHKTEASEGEKTLECGCNFATKKIYNLKDLDAFKVLCFRHHRH